MLSQGWVLPLPTFLCDFVSVSESSMSDTAGTTLSTGVHAGLMQERPRWMTSCTYLGNNRVSEPHRSGAGPPPHSKVTTG